MSNTATASAAIEILFVCYASKRHFIARNGIAQSEIISETPGAITILDLGENFQASPFVCSVKPA